MNDAYSRSHIVRYHFLDVSKAIAISLVLIWHLKPFIVRSDQAGTHLEALQFGLNVFYKEISLIAVPLLVLVSLYIFFGKLEATGSIYVFRRLRRLSVLFVSWTTFQFVCYFLLYVLKGIKAEHSFSFPSSIASPAYLLMNGGPPLPIVGGSVFYFIFVLICTTGIAAIYHRSISKLECSTTIAYILTLLFLCYFALYSIFSSGKGVPYWRLDNFLVYIPLAYIAWKDQKSLHINCVVLLNACFVGLVVQNILLGSPLGGSGAYSRLSIVIGSIALFSALRLVVTKPPHRFVMFLAIYSLGIFAIHKYWQLVVAIAMINFSSPFSGIPLDVNALIKGVICVALTLGTVSLIGRTNYHWLIR